ncbi:hypothetical protein Tco_0987744 [Tanacetum coccineum]
MLLMILFVWNDIIQVGKDLDALNGAFINHFSKLIGNELGTSLWLDKWVGNGRLCDRFPRLFQLEGDKKVRVGNRGIWVDRVWEWKWGWVRNLRGRAVGDLVELESIISSVSLRQNCSDGWKSLKGRIPVRMELDKKGIDMNSILYGIWFLRGGGIGPVNVFTSKEILKHNGGVVVSKGAKKLWNAVI